MTFSILFSEFLRIIESSVCFRSTVDTPTSVTEGNSKMCIFDQFKCNMQIESNFSDVMNT